MHGLQGEVDLVQRRLELPRPQVAGCARIVDVRALARVIGQANGRTARPRPHISRGRGPDCDEDSPEDHGRVLVDPVVQADRLASAGLRDAEPADISLCVGAVRQFDGVRQTFGAVQPFGRWLLPGLGLIISLALAPGAAFSASSDEPTIGDADCRSCTRVGAMLSHRRHGASTGNPSGGSTNATNSRQVPWSAHRALWCWPGGPHA
jgi:hypothetical protein